MTSRSFKGAIKGSIFFIIFLCVFAVGINLAHANTCTSTGGGGNYNVAASWTSCGGVAPKNTDTITIVSGSPITMVQATTTAGVTINSGATLTGSTFLLTDTGNYINNGTHNGSGGVTVNGASAVISGTGATTNSGTFTISGATGPSFSSTSSITISGNLTMSGPVTITAGGAVTVLGRTAISGGITITNNGTFNASSTNGITGTLTSSTWTQGSNATLNFGGGTTSFLATGTLNATSTGNTVNYNDAGNQTCKVTQYYNLTLGATGTKTCTPTSPILGNVVMGGTTASWTLTTTSTIDGTLTLSGTTGGLTTGGVPFTVNGSTTISGDTLSLTNNTGAKTFTGLVTLNGGTLSGASTNTFFGAGITNNTGTVTLTGTANVSSTGAIFSGATVITFGAVIVTSPGTVTNNGITALTSTLTGSGSWTQGSGASLRLSDVAASIITVSTFDAHTNAGNIVNYNASGNQTCLTTQYQNLYFAGTGTKTCTPTSPILGSVILGGTTDTWTLTTTSTIDGTLSIAATTGSLTTGGVPFAVNGTTTISGGTLSLTNNVGTKTFTGLVSLSGGTLSGASTNVFLGGGIENDAGTVTLTGSANVSSTGVTFSGANLITLGGVIVPSPGTVTNNGTTTLTSTLTGSGTWTQGTSSTLNLSDVAVSIVTVSTFDATTNVNTVNYNGAGTQVCDAVQYDNLSFAGSGTKTCLPTSAVLGNLTYGGSGTWTLGGALTIDGNLTITSGTIDVSSANNYPVTLAGNLTNSATFNTEADTVTLDGTSEQILSGTLTGASDFWNLVITNNSGSPPSDCETTGFTPSVYFAASATVSGTFTITTGGNVGVQYSNGLTYTVANTDWVGPSGNPIYFRSSIAGSGSWTLDVTGTQTPLEYINVSRSDATGAAINALNITNTDCGGNSNWNFGASSTSPTSYTQAAYQLYANQNSSTPGPTLAGSNASATLSSTGEAFRIRMLLAVDTTSSIAGVDAFYLQFANKGNGADCSSPQFLYTTITTSTAIAYKTNSLVQDGSLLTPTSTDPTDGGRVVVEQTYQSAGNFTVTSTIPTGEDGNWDFSLIDNGSPGSTDYCFQAVLASGTTPLYAYAVYPEVITATSPDPVLSNIVLNSGTSITLTPDATTSITVVASTTDPQGPGDISFATGTIYQTSLGTSCSANNQNCYQIPSSSCTFSGSTSTVTCTAGLWYFAASTGDPSSSFPSDSWTGAITVTDAQSNTDSGTSTPQNVNVLTAINVTTSSINYGSIKPGSNTAAVNQGTVVQNVGNSSTSLQLSGTAFVRGANNFATSSQHYATTTFIFGGSEQQLSGTQTTVSGFTLTAPTSTTNVQSSIFWGAQVPLGVATGTYTASTTFTSLFSQ